jgi:hypothetical protein
MDLDFKALLQIPSNCLYLNGKKDHVSSSNLLSIGACKPKTLKLETQSEFPDCTSTRRNPFRLLLVIRKGYFGGSSQEPPWMMCCQFLSLWQNTWCNQLKKRKDLFCLIVSEVSVHGHLALLLWAIMEQYIVRRWGRVGLHISWQLGSKERNRKDRNSNIPFQGHTPSDLTSSYLALPLKVSTPSQ